ncbi:hypothetical protein [Natronococcus jeotgali]|nr:hypothetical protein [Natronococcus jeotgali]
MNQIVLAALTGAVSALLGAIAIVGLRQLYQRRKLVAALHAEITDNLLSVNTKLESNMDLFIGLNLKNETYSTMKTVDPILYLKIKEECTLIHDHYHMVPMMNQFRELSINESFDAERKNEFRQVYMSHHDTSIKAANQIERYVNKTYFRRLFYYRAIVQTIDSLKIDEKDESE